MTSASGLVQVFSHAGTPSGQCEAVTSGESSLEGRHANLLNR